MSDRHILPARIAVDGTLVLTQWREADAAEHVRLVASAWHELHPWFHWATPDYSERNFHAWLSDSCERLARGGIDYAIRLEDSAVGTLSTMPHSIEAVELSYWLGPAHWGGGLVTKSLIALEPYLSAAGFARAEIHYVEGNLSSARVGQRAGYKFDREYNDRPNKQGIRHVALTKELRQ